MEEPDQARTDILYNGKMEIALNIIKHYLRNAYFITGTAYAGKSTMVKMLAEKYDMIFCGENYTSDISDKIADPAYQKDLCYIPQLKDFRDFVKRAPEEYERWIFSVQKEVAGFEIAELIRLSGTAPDRKIIVDTNMPLGILKQISDYDHIAVMLSPQSMSVERFFDRGDPEKQYILSVINSCENPDEVMNNYREGLALINSKKHYDEFANAGLFTLIRENDRRDTKEEVLAKLAGHFGLERVFVRIEKKE